MSLETSRLRITGVNLVNGAYELQTERQTTMDNILFIPGLAPRPFPFFDNAENKFEPPDDWVPTLPCDFFRSRSGELTHDMDFTQYTTGYTEIFVNFTTGSDSTGDGSVGNPYKTIAKVLIDIESGSAGQYLITVTSDAVFFRDEGWRSTALTFANKSVTIRPQNASNKVILTNAQRGLSWTAEDNVFRTTRSATNAVYDLRVLDSNGLPIPYENVTTLVACKDTANTWYTDGTLVYVNTFDGLTPTGQVLVCISNTFTADLSGNSKLHFDRVHMYASGLHGCFIRGNISATEGEFCAKDCAFVGGILTKATGDQGNALRPLNLKNTFLFNCIAAYARRDGIGAAYENITVADRRDCLLLEFKTKSYSNGLISAANSNNATSCHDAASCLRLGGDYNLSKGPVTVDVNGCYSILIDCNSANSTNGDAAYEFYNLTNPGTYEAKCILVNCTTNGETLGSPQLFLSDGNVDATLYRRNLPNLKTGSAVPVFIP
jgi:hypothetical protein